MRLRASLIAALPVLLGLSTACSIYDTSLLLDAAPAGAGGQAGDGPSEGGKGGEAGDSGEGGESGEGGVGGVAGKGGAGGKSGAGQGGQSGSTEDSKQTCSDGVDNDGDTYADCEDKSCCGVVDCSAQTESYCAKHPVGAGGAAGMSGSGGAGGDAECNDPSDCDDHEPCTADDCQDGACVNLNDDTFKPPQMAGNCRAEVCANGALSSTADNGDKPADDGDPCTLEACTGGAVSTKAAADNTACKVGANSGTCKAGKCTVECAKDTDCDDKNPCTTNACTGNKCVFATLTDGSPTPGVSPVDGDCKRNVCQGGAATDVPDPLDLPATQACKDVACSGMTASVINKTDGSDCSSGGNGNICIGGACKATECGDGIKTGSEACDKSDLGGLTCTLLNLSSGQLSCKADCTRDTSKCTGSCGDGKLDAGEECDETTSPAAAGNGCSALCTVEPAVGDLVITEVMFNPTFSGGTDDGEWFEVYNRSTKTYDLRNLVIVSGKESAVIKADSPLKLAPSAYAVFVRFADAKKNGGLTFLYSYEAKVTFTNGADDLSLEVATTPSTVVDKVTWTSTIGGSNKYNGISFSLDKNKLDPALNDDVLNWCPAKTPISASNTDKGTPGQTNDGCP